MGKIDLTVDRRLLELTYKRYPETDPDVKGCMILAPPGSGKTTLCMRYPFLADGDTICGSVYEQLYELYGAHFWRHKDFDTTLERRMKMWTLGRFFSDNEGALVLDVKGPSQWVKAIVILPVKLHRKFVEHRLKTQSRLQPTWAEVKGARKEMKQFAARTGIPIFDNFDAAIAHSATGIEWTANFEQRVKVPRYVGTMKNWRLEGIYQGYKDTDPPNGGSTRVVWQSLASKDTFCVLKLFDDNGIIATTPRTVKFWRTSKLNADKMKWKSSRHKVEFGVKRQQQVTTILHNLIESIDIGSMADMHEVY